MLQLPVKLVGLRVAKLHANRRLCDALHESGWSESMARRNWHSIRKVGLMLALCLMCFANLACQTARISGTYIANQISDKTIYTSTKAQNTEIGPDWVDMLQLTQTENGQITGVYSHIGLDVGGHLDSKQESVKGASDAGQLTLTINPGLFERNMGGTITWTLSGDRIELQVVGTGGDARSEVFTRSSPAEFKTDTDKLRNKAEGIFLTASLLRGAQDRRQTIQKAEEWISNAELHAQTIPRIKDYYQKVESDMRSRVARERATPNPVARGQISVGVSQEDVLGAQADVQVHQQWDLTILDSGQHLSEMLGRPPICGSSELQQQLAAPQSAVAWTSACQQALSEKARFDPILKSIIDQRAELKSFQDAAQSHRKALVDEASRIQ